MKGLFLILLLVGAGYFGYAAFDHFKKGGGGNFPVVRTLEDGNGRKVKAKILGVESGYVLFRRVSDERYFEYPLADLSKSDQEFLLKVRQGPHPNVKLDAGTLHVSNMRQKISDLEEENEILQRKASDPSGYYDGISARKYLKEIAENESRINHLQVKIHEFESKGFAD